MKHVISMISLLGIFLASLFPFAQPAPEQTAGPEQPQGLAEQSPMVGDISLPPHLFYTLNMMGEDAKHLDGEIANILDDDESKVYTQEMRTTRLYHAPSLKFLVAARRVIRDDNNKEIGSEWVYPFTHPNNSVVSKDDPGGDAVKGADVLLPTDHPLEGGGKYYTQDMAIAPGEYSEVQVRTAVYGDLWKDTAHSNGTSFYYLVRVAENWRMLTHIQVTYRAEHDYNTSTLSREDEWKTWLSEVRLYSEKSGDDPIEINWLTCDWEAGDNIIDPDPTVTQGTGCGKFATPDDGLDFFVDYKTKRAKLAPYLDVLVAALSSGDKWEYPLAFTVPPDGGDINAFYDKFALLKAEHYKDIQLRVNTYGSIWQEGLDHSDTFGYRDQIKPKLDTVTFISWLTYKIAFAYQPWKDNIFSDEDDVWKTRIKEVTVEGSYSDWTSPGCEVLDMSLTEATYQFCDQGNGTPLGIGLDTINAVEAQTTGYVLFPCRYPDEPERTDCPPRPSTYPVLIDFGNFDAKGNRIPGHYPYRVVIDGWIDKTKGGTGSFGLVAYDTYGNHVYSGQVLLIPMKVGSADTQTFHKVSSTKLTVANGSPGLSALTVTINDTRLTIANLRPDENRTVSIAAAMKPGSGNTVTILGTGNAGGQASIALWQNPYRDPPLNFLYLPMIRQ